MLKRAAITAGLELTSLLSSLGICSEARGQGAIFTLHHVRPRPARTFQPNALLDITPEFLEMAILTLKRAGYEFIRLEHVPERLRGSETAPFACFTLDDGLRDNAEFAEPIFTRHAVPFTIFLCNGFIDATHSMWWQTADLLLNEVDRLGFDFGRGAETLAAATPSEKLRTFGRIADFINTTDEAKAVARLDDAALRHGIDPLAVTRDLTMRESELRALLANPLVSFGAHTASHRNVARLPAVEAEREIGESIERVAAIAAERPRAFAYPYGLERCFSPREAAIQRRLGVEIGLTTRPGTLTPAHLKDAATLPRISLNGLYQKTRYVRALASGIPFRMMG